MKNTKSIIVITLLFASLWANVGVAQILQKLGNMAKQPLTKEDLNRKKEYTTLEEALKDRKQVFKLNLVDKNLTSLPDEFYELENLQVLDLSNNPQLNWAEVIPKLAKLNMLSELGLGTNNLKELPAAITKISRLYNLALPKNPELNYEQVLGVLKDCKKLEKLDIGTNTFKILPKGLNQLKNLNLLILEGNIYLEDINEITNMPNLERLSIHQCISLKTLPTELGKAKNLSLIDMGGCAKLTDSLSATFNRLADLGKLRVLSIKGSAIKKIPVEIGKLKQLQVLDLSFNPIEEISDDICKLRFVLTELLIPEETLPKERLEKIQRCLLRCQLTTAHKMEDVKIDTTGTNTKTPPKPIQNTVIKSNPKYDGLKYEDLIAKIELKGKAFRQARRELEGRNDMGFREAKVVGDTTAPAGYWVYDDPTADQVQDNGDGTVTVSGNLLDIFKSNTPILYVYKTQLTPEQIQEKLLKAKRAHIDKHFDTQGSPLISWSVDNINPNVGKPTIKVEKTANNIIITARRDVDRAMQNGVSEECTILIPDLEGVGQISPSSGFRVRIDTPKAKYLSETYNSQAQGQIQFFLDDRTGKMYGGFDFTMMYDNKKVRIWGRFENIVLP